jgi:hypothetical protein
MCESFFLLSLKKIDILTVHLNYILKWCNDQPIIDIKCQERLGSLSRTK